MADVHKLPDIRQIEREASEWIARLHADDASVADRARFEVWLGAHPQHVRIYESLLGTWRQFAAAGPLVRAVRFAQSASGAVPRRRRWVPVAAILSGILVLLAVLYVQRETPEARFTTAVGEQAKISLPDGSEMELNSNSEARVDYAVRSRVIHLDRGESFFKVAHDVNRPFWVVSGSSWVRAVGTAFNVYVRPGGVQVTVSEGVVKVESAVPLLSTVPSEEALSHVQGSILTAGQQLNVRGSTVTTVSLSSADLTRSVAWRDGTVSFDNRPLSEVVSELSRYTTLQMVISDESLRQLAVGGTFQANPQGAEALLAMLEQGFGLRVRRDQNTAYLESSPAAKK